MPRRRPPATSLGWTAALLAGAIPLPERPDGEPARVGVVLSGGNADLDRQPWNRAREGSS